MLRFALIYLLILAWAACGECKELHRESFQFNSDENASGKRTLMISKLVLLPLLAGIGVKFLILLPIILSKIAILGILSFVSSNLSLFVSAIFGLRSYFFENKSDDEDYDDYYRQKNQHDPYASHKDIRDGHYNYDHDDNYDSHDKHKHRYRDYESFHSGYNPHYSGHSDRYDHKSKKWRFRPFSLLGRIKDAIKDHFHKSGPDRKEKYRLYNYDDFNHVHKYHSHDYSENYPGSGYKMREAKYPNPVYSIHHPEHRPSVENAYFESYRVPENGLQKGEIKSSRVVQSESIRKNPLSITEGSVKDPPKISTVIGDVGKLMHDSSSLTETTTEYQVYENDPILEEPFIVLGVHPQTRASDSPVAFYATD